MKRALTFILALSLLITALPVFAFADAPSGSEQDELFRLACEVFPEYADQILETPAVTQNARSIRQDTLVYSETRAVSDTETLELRAYDSGRIDIVNTAYGFTGSKSESSSNVSTDLIGNVTFRFSSNSGIGSVSIGSIGFIIHQNGTGYFTSYGSCSVSGSVTCTSESKSQSYIKHAFVFNSSSSSKLYLKFEAYFSGGNLIGWFGET